MKRYDLFSGLFLLLVSLGACWIAYRLRIGSLRTPGPGFLPFGVAALLGFMSMGLLIKVIFQRLPATGGDQAWRGIRWKTILLVLGSLVGYGMGLEALGFTVCTFLFLVVLFGVVGGKKWWWTMITSTLVVGTTYLIFVTWLGCEFPRGFFGI